MDIGKRIQNARKAANMTQAALGKEIGVSGAMIGQWENNLRNPKPETLERIANALGISLWDLTPTTLSDAIKFGYEQGYWSRSEEFREAEDEVDAIIAELEAHKDDPKDLDLLAAYRKLNMDGQRIAIERVEELTQIPKYQRTSPQKQLLDKDETNNTPE